MVDDAIVVGEHADFRARRLGEAPAVAAENAARRMFLPVFSATLTTIIAFFGLVAIGGRFGDLIADIPFTVIAVLLASLVECFLILPNHMAHALAHIGASEHWYDWPSRQVNRGFALGPRRDCSGRSSPASIRARYPVLAGAVAAAGQPGGAASSGATCSGGSSTRPSRGRSSGNFAMLPGATREDTLEMMRELQRAVEDAGRASTRPSYGANPLDLRAWPRSAAPPGRGLAGADTKEPTSSARSRSS